MEKNDKIKDEKKVLTKAKEKVKKPAKKKAKKKVKTPKKIGRPKLAVDWKSAEGLAAILCTGEEISGFLGISYDTLERRIKETYKETFADWYRKHSVNGLISLRRSQFANATIGNNVTMQIWLGKQLLGQTDKIETENNTNLNITEFEVVEYDD